MCYSTMDHPCSNDVGCHAKPRKIERLANIQANMSIFGAWGSNDKLGVVWIMMSPRRRLPQAMRMVHGYSTSTSPIFWRTNYNESRSWRHMASRDSNTNKTIQALSMLYKLPQKPMVFTPPAGSNHQKHSDTWNFSSDQTQ